MTAYTLVCHDDDDDNLQFGLPGWRPGNWKRLPPLAGLWSLSPCPQNMDAKQICLRKMAFLRSPQFNRNTMSDWTEAPNTLKCQTHRQKIFLECRNWFHFGRCQWAGWRQKYKSVYQQNFHWEFSDILSEISESGKYRGNICEHPPHIIWSMKV